MCSPQRQHRPVQAVTKCSPVPLPRGGTTTCGRYKMVEVNAKRYCRRDKCIYEMYSYEGPNISLNSLDFFVTLTRENIRNRNIYLNGLFQSVSNFVSKFVFQAVSNILNQSTLSKLLSCLSYMIISSVALL